MLDRAISGDKITCDNNCGASYIFGMKYLEAGWEGCDHILCPTCAKTCPCAFCHPSNKMTLARATCDWVIDAERDTAVCRAHGEICDGVDSPHFLDHKPKEAS